MFTFAIVFGQMGLDERFLEAVCGDKGYPRIRIFSDYKEAINWMAHTDISNMANVESLSLE